MCRRRRALAARLFFLLLAIGVSTARAADDEPLGIGTLRSSNFETKTLQTCEGENARLECAGVDEQIAIELANFGRFSLQPCNAAANAEYSTSCLNNATTLVLANRCNGRRDCEFLVAASMFGDACPGTLKYLEAKYTCVVITTTVAPPTSSVNAEIAGTRSLTPVDGGDDATSRDHDNYAVIEGDSSARQRHDPLRASTSTLPPRTHCGGEFYRLVQWPSTEGGASARASCPLGAHGDARRSCHGNGRWSSHADLGECKSSATRHLEAEFRQAMELNTLTPIDHFEDALQLVRSQKLLGGDLRALIVALARAHSHNEPLALAYDRRQLVETARATTSAAGEMLAAAQRDAWLDVNAREQRPLAIALVVAVRTALCNVARSLSSGVAETFDASTLVAGAAAVVRGDRGNLDFPPSPIVAANALSIVSNFGADRVTIALDALATAETSPNELEIVYSSLANLGSFLSHVKVDTSPSASACRRVMISRIVSVQLASRAHQPVDVSRVPLIISFTTPPPLVDKIEASSTVAQPAEIRCERLRSSSLASAFSGDDDDETAETCELLAHNATHTVCRYYGGGEFAVFVSDCETSKLQIGANKETFALYASCALAVVGMSVYAIALSIVEPATSAQKRYAFIPRNLCTTIIGVELTLCVWFALPKSGLIAALVVFALIGMAIAALGWLGMQLFTQLYTLVALLNHHALVSPSHIRLVGWGAPTIALVALLALSADFGALLAGHAAFGRPIASLAWTLVAIGCTAHGALVLAITLLRARRLRVGYKPPASSDADAFDALRSLLARTVPLVIVADAFISGAVGLVLAVSFSRVAIAALWLVVGANIVQAILTLRVLNCKQLLAGNVFGANCDRNSRFRTDNLPKNSVFSSIVQPPAHHSGLQYAYSEQTSLTKEAAARGASQLHMFDRGADSNATLCAAAAYTPTIGGIHDQHQCECTYATIPTDYNPYYAHQPPPLYVAQHLNGGGATLPALQHYRIYTQHAGNPPQLQLPPQPPPPPTTSARYCCAASAAMATASGATTTRYDASPPPPLSSSSGASSSSRDRFTTSSSSGSTATATTTCGVLAAAGNNSGESPSQPPSQPPPPPPAPLPLTCLEHGSRCPSLVALHLSNAYAHHPHYQPQPPQPHHRQTPPSPLVGASTRHGGESSAYETSRSTTSSGLLRMDLSQNPPVFIECDSA